MPYLINLNWNTVPMTYNDSFTYMQWLGKLTTVAQDHETRLTSAEGKITNLEEAFASFSADYYTKSETDALIDGVGDELTALENAVFASISNHESRIATLESSVQRLIDTLNFEGTSRHYYLNPYNSETGIGYTTSGSSITATLSSEEYGEYDCADVRLNLTYNGSTTDTRLTLTADGVTSTSDGYSGSLTAAGALAITTPGFDTINRIDLVLYKSANTKSEQEAVTVSEYTALNINDDNTLDSSDAAKILQLYAAWQQYKSQQGIDNTRDNAYTWYTSVFSVGTTLRSYTRAEWDVLCDTFGGTLAAVPDSSAAANILRFYAACQASTYTNSADGWAAFRGRAS